MFIETSWRQGKNSVWGKETFSFFYGEVVTVNRRNHSLWCVHCQSPEWRIDTEISLRLTDRGNLCAGRETCGKTTLYSTKLTVVTLDLSRSFVVLKSFNYRYELMALTTWKDCLIWDVWISVGSDQISNYIKQNQFHERRDNSWQHQFSQLPRKSCASWISLCVWMVLTDVFGTGI